MKFLLDACVGSRALHNSLVESGHDVVSAQQAYPSAPDDALLATAHREGRVLVTEDKDFGELVFAGGLPHGCIVRFFRLSIDERVAALRQLIAHESEAMGEDVMIVISKKGVRMRPGPRRPMLTVRRGND